MKGALRAKSDKIRILDHLEKAFSTKGALRVKLTKIRISDDLGRALLYQRCFMKGYWRKKSSA